MNSIEHSNTVYLVSPDVALGNALSALLGLYAIPVHTFADAESFLAAYTLNDAGRSCLLVEDDLPELGALALVRRLRSLGFKQPTIVLSGDVDRDLRQRALYCGATELIEKPLAERFVIDHLAMLAPDTRFLPPAAGECVKLCNGGCVTFRIMRPDDADSVQAFVRRLSDESRYLRFFSGIDRLSPTMLARFTHPDYPHNCALLATVVEDGQELVIATARYEPTTTINTAEYALVVADEWHGLGIASRLMRGLTTCAAIAGVELLQGTVLRGNQRMLKLAHGLDFTASIIEDDETIVFTTRYLRAPKQPTAAKTFADKQNDGMMTG